MCCVVATAFAIPNEKFELEFTQESSSQLLHRLVAAAHGQGRNVKLSIGGWTGSAHFSRAVRTSAGRTTLCKSILEAYQTYNLDGIDLDWEYPNSPGAGNEYGSDDSEHFVKFLRQLRKTLPPTARITAAASDLPFMGKDGQPMTDVSAFADVLDWVLLMNYDVFGCEWSDSFLVGSSEMKYAHGLYGLASPTPGPNAPLSNSCGSSAQPLANAEAAIRSWTSAGFSPKQLVLGIPAYGYISRSTAKQLASRDEGAGNSTSGGGTSGDGGNASDNGEDLAINAVDSVELTSDDGSSDGGQVSFQALVRQGALVRNNGGGYDGGGGFERNWDDCSSTVRVLSR
jgi:chitinase